MRLDRVFINGFKNLSNVEADFDEGKLTTVIIGENGAGKSNLLEALVDIFRAIDMDRARPRYTYEIDYRIDGHSVRLSNRSGGHQVIVDSKVLTKTEFKRQKAQYFPDLIFGYYSGGSRRLEKLFDGHQRSYYDDIKLSDDLEVFRQANQNRRLFYCRPIHGVFALLSLFAFPDDAVIRLLKEKLGITGFHSSLALFREPWFAAGKKVESSDLWGARGPAGRCARAIRDASFHPMRLNGNPIDDYRDKQQNEEQFACFLRNVASLSNLAAHFNSDQEMFIALEAIDISDLIRELYLWVTRKENTTGDVSYADLSDGERQLLMVLGLIRASRGKRALFLLDEPDTHLNPAWQHGYLELIRQWTGVAADAANCQIVMTSHNPLTIAALSKDEVRVMFRQDNGEVQVKPPYTDPRGMGFTATLTEIFGLPTTLDTETQRQLDERNTLARIEKRSETQERLLIELNDKLNRLGFMFEDREPLYQAFLQAMHEVRYADKPPLSPDQIAKRHSAMSHLIRSLMSSGAGEPKQ